ncbi:MAG: ribosomal protein L7/L12 [Oleispira sp.]
MNSTVELEPEVIAEIQSGKKISAIKTLRRLRGIGLKEAKEMIDLYATQNNIKNQSVTGSGSSSKVFFLIVLAGVSYFLYKFAG